MVLPTEGPQPCDASVPVAGPKSKSALAPPCAAPRRAARWKAARLHPVPHRDGFGRRLLGETAPDPAARAIRCYGKAGFRAVGQVQTPDGVALADGWRTASGGQ